MVWLLWFGFCGLASVVWLLWFGFCGLASVVWLLWFGFCGLSLVLQDCVPGVPLGVAGSESLFLRRAQET